MDDVIDGYPHFRTSPCSVDFIGFDGDFASGILWSTNSLLLDMAIEIVDLPINSVMIFQFVILIYQMVKDFIGLSLGYDWKVWSFNGNVMELNEWLQDTFGWWLVRAWAMIIWLVVWNMFYFP